ncbi:glycosyltransferase [Pontibacter sp. E15-1]|uniref:glycosyltransferase n=1 Tax=Pontibacter sp. E15-1 TaxID=2919918 RepID=UPI001F4FA673|nr:glycosyltransferase [Pontibacter sp. E15-1]MCJ8166400.1 glycosyltransferase [Pontibacter sp. E15-1]
MSKKPKQTIVVSGINMVEGGILSILSDCLAYLDTYLHQDYNIVALVHKKSFFQTKHVTYIEYEDAKSSWFRRIWYEYFYFKKLSRELSPLLWLSLHDMSPNIDAKIKAVYCHNSTPFYSTTLETLKMEPKLVAFSAFYKYLYRINIKKNDYIIVQQKWLREEFKKLFNVDNIIVSHPTVNVQPGSAILNHSKKLLAQNGLKQNFIFFYPSFPRVFKNFEVAFEASKLLQQRGYHNFKLIVTLAGNENKYAAHLYRLYKNDPLIEWKGLLPRNEVFDIYAEADCLLFPSKLETWGLPITEFREYNKPMLLANLPYAKETAEGYSKAKFVEPDNPPKLADAMEAALNNCLVFDKTECENQPRTKLEVVGWKELFSVLLYKNEGQHV